MNELRIRIMTSQDPIKAEDDIREAVKRAGYDIEDFIVEENVA